MAVVNPSDVIEFTMFGTLQDSQVLNTFHYVFISANPITAPFYNAELTAAGLSFINKVWNGGANPLKDRLSSSYSLSKVRVQPVAPQRKYYIDVGVSETGSIGGPSNPAAVQRTIALSTDRAIRGATGSKRFAGEPLADLNGGSWSLVSTISWNLFAPVLTSNIFGIGGLTEFRPTVWSPKRPADRSVVLRAEVMDTVRVSHSRTKGVGI